MSEIDPIEIPVVLKGLPDVHRSLTSLRDTMIKLEVESVKAAEAASKKRIKVYQTELQQKKKMINEISKKVDDQLNGSLGGGARRGIPRPPGAGGSTTPGFMELTGLDKSVGGLKKFATGVGIAAGAFLALKAGVEIATEAITQFGSFLISDVIKPAFALETFATQVENTTKGEIKAQQIMDKTRAIQVGYNIDAMEAAEAAASFGDKTGSVATGLDVLNDVAPMVKAFGGNLKESMDSAAALFNKLKEINPQATMDDVRKLLLAQLGQGQVEGGKFTSKEVAGLGGELTKGAGSLAGDAVKRLSDISAALQAGGITGKADVSMSALNAFLTEMPLLAKQGKISGARSEINKQGQIKDLAGAITKVLIASKGDQTRLRSMGFGEGSASFLAQFMPGFQEGIKSGKKPQQAAEEALAAFEKIRKATATEAEVKEASTRVMQTSGQKWETAVNKVKDKLLNIAEKDIDKFIDDFAKAVPEITKAAVLLSKAIIGAAESILDIGKGIEVAKTGFGEEAEVFKEKGLIEGIKFSTSNLLSRGKLGVEAAAERKAREQSSIGEVDWKRNPETGVLEPIPKELSPQEKVEREAKANTPIGEAGVQNELNKLNLGDAQASADALAKSLQKAAEAAEDLTRSKTISARGT